MGLAQLVRPNPLLFDIHSNVHMDETSNRATMRSSYVLNTRKFSQLLDTS